MQQLVSLAPSATSTLLTLGLEDRLAGVTAHDDVADVPVIGGWLNPDLDRLDELEPDLVLTADPLQRAVRDAVSDRGHPTFHHEPGTFDEVLDGFAELGAAVGRPAVGRELAGAAERRVEAVRAATPADPDRRPVVYCEEWPDPPMAAGNWVPEAVRAAGGRYPFAEPGARSAEVDPDAVIDAGPDHVVVHHCGLGEAATADHLADWGLDATVHVIDDALLNQPSPRLVEGVECLAERLHGFEPSSEPWAPA